MPIYGSLSRYYDLLMEDGQYPERARYIFDICKRFDHELGKTLDLCCGTGSLTRELYKLGADVFGVDGSVEMLSEAAQRGDEENINILYVCQLMQQLDLPYTVDTCVCTQDSLNHLVDENDLQMTFDAVSKSLNTGGLFIFDVNTPYKHREVLGNKDFVLEAENVLCAWQNELFENDVVEITLDFFEEDENGLYTRCSEYLTERAYSDKEIRNMLEKSGFKVLAYYGFLTFDAPESDEQRVVYTAQKL